MVYYGRYLPYFDHARVEYLRLLGLEVLDGELMERKRDEALAVIRA